MKEFLKPDFSDWHALHENLDMAYMLIFRMIFEMQLLHDGLYGSRF